MDYASDIASRAGQLIVSATQNGITLSDAQIQHYGRYAMMASALYYVAVTFKDPVPADAKYAIDAHVPSGFDRSIIASRLAQRYTNQMLESELGLKALREALRTETTRDGKLRLWSSVLEGTLVGIVASAYTHSLTLSLWSLKNTSRVLVFVLRKREAAAEQRRTDPGRGLQGKLKTWWHGGTQGLITDTLMRRMAEQVEKQASPFSTSGINEDDDLDVDNNNSTGDGSDSTGLAGSRRSGAYGYADHAATPERPADGAARSGCGSGADGGAGGASSSSTGRQAGAASAKAQTFLNGEFSVRRLLTRAVPHIVACARVVVRHVLANLPPEHKLDMAGSVRGVTLRFVLNAIAERMERTACVPAWLQNPPSPSSSAAPCGAAASTTPPGPLRLDSTEKISHSDEEDEEDIVDYPRGSTVMVGPDGRPLPLSRGGSHARSLLEELGSDPALHHQVTEAEREVEEETARREQLSQQQTVGFFQELIHHDSFAELVLVAAAEQLSAAFKQASDLSAVRGYDVVTDSAKLLLTVPSFESCRQKQNDADFVVRSYLKLFCEELVRSTCSQTVGV